MPAPLPADWPAIQAMAVRGVTQAEISHQTGIAIGTIAARSKREGWIVQAKAMQADVQAAKLTAAVQSGQMQAHASDGVVLAEHSLAEDEKETRLSHSRLARKLARQAEESEIVIQTPADVLALVKHYAVTHRLDQDKGGPHLTLNLFAVQTGIEPTVTDI